MIRTLLALLLLLSGLSLQAQNAQLDEDNGVLGFHLGAHRDSVPMHLDMAGKYQHLNRFHPHADSLDYNGIPVSNVTLYYWDNHLHSIDLKTKGEGTSQMLSLIEALYGEGTDVANFDAQKYWQGEKATLVLDQNIVTKDATWSWMCEDVQKKYELALYNLKYKNK